MLQDMAQHQPVRLDAMAPSKVLPDDAWVVSLVGGVEPCHVETLREEHLQKIGLTAADLDDPGATQGRLNDPGHFVQVGAKQRADGLFVLIVRIVLH